MTAPPPLLCRCLHVLSGLLPAAAGGQVRGRTGQGLGRDVGHDPPRSERDVEHDLPRSERNVEDGDGQESGSQRKVSEEKTEWVR